MVSFQLTMNGLASTSAPKQHFWILNYSLHSYSVKSINEIHILSNTLTEDIKNSFSSFFNDHYTLK